MTWS